MPSRIGGIESKDISTPRHTLCMQALQRQTRHSATDRPRRRASPVTLETDTHERTAARTHPQGAGNRHARRQVLAGLRPRLHERRAGAGASCRCCSASATRRPGKNTAGFISGYRGSPLGGYDQALWAAKKYLAGAEHRVPARRQRGTGATAVWGTQQLDLYAARQQQVRRRVRHLVRQGPGRGPLLRRVQARQHGRHHEARRRDRGGRRRPRGQEHHRARTRATTSSRPAACRCSSRPTCRRSSTWACTRSR